MPYPCIVPEHLVAAAGCFIGGKAAVKKALARLNAADERELAALRARVGAEDAPAEPEAESAPRA